MNFDSKIAFVVREDLAIWQKLNVVAFLSTGLVGANENLIGEPYSDADGNNYNALAVQPMIILVADAPTMRKTYDRAMQRNVRLSLYTKEMFATGHDAANRAAVAKCKSEELDIVGLALHEDRKLVDKITRGAKMHP